MRRLVALLCLQLALLSLAAPAAQAAMLFDAGPGGLDAAVVQMSRLPSWVQVTSPSAPLYTSDTTDGAVSSSLVRFTFLRVLGGGVARLHVDVYDDNGNQGARGWVDPNDVLPSAPGIDWLVSSRPTSLLKDAADGAQTLRNLDRFTALQQIDGPVQDRIEVRVYRPDFSILDQGWVDVADIGPAFPPQARVQSPVAGTLGLRNLSGANQQQAFFDATAGAARTAALQTGVPASVTVAQAILESDWGRSQLAQSANNFFGIKATSSLGNDGVVWLPTSEYDGSGQEYDTISPFRAYKSLTDSMTDHDKLLLTGRYAVAMQVANDPRQFAQQLYEAGYSTDPAYPDKLIALMDRYDLYRLDA
jgi:mannosyl-glycoprotein endo-beta-N-acetylglucosaminidase